MTIATSKRDMEGAVPAGTAPAAAPVLAVENLCTYFDLRRGLVKAVDGISFTLAAGETLAIVGESGCGKSITALSLLRLVPSPPGRIAGGSVRLEGRDLVTLDEEAMRGVRGKDVAMIFQEPMTSLNPVITIGDQIAEAVLAARECDPATGLAEGRRHAASDAHPGARAARARISASAFGRHAPARHDRHGAGLQSESADRRRADHRARRHYPGADPRSHPRFAATAGHGGDPHHARPRCRRRDRAARDRDVCRAQGGGGVGRGTIRAPATSLHARADGLDPAPAADARRCEQARWKGCRKSPAWSRRSAICRTAACLRRAAPMRSSAAVPSIRTTRRSVRAIGPPAGARASFTEMAMLEASASVQHTPERAAPPVLEVRDLKKHFPIRNGSAATEGRHGALPSTASASGSRRAKPSAWSANPVAASPPSAAPYCG